MVMGQVGMNFCGAAGVKRLWTLNYRKMKRLFVIAAVLLSMVGVNAQSKVDVSVKAGVGMSNFIGADSEYCNVKFSYRLGVGLDVPTKDVWGFRTGLYLTGLGTKNSEEAYGIKAEAKIKPIYLELPLMATATVPLPGDFKMSIGVGPYLAVGVGGKVTASVDGGRGNSIDESYNVFGDGEDEGGMRRFDAGLGVDLNFEVKRIIFGLDTRFGLAKPFEDVKTHNLSAQFVVGYRF